MTSAWQGDPCVCQAINFYVITTTTTNCISPLPSELFLRSDLWDRARQKNLINQNVVVSSLCLQLCSYTQLQRAENWGLKIHVATFFPRNSKCFRCSLSCEVISGWITPCPSRRQGNRGPDTWRGFVRAPLIRRQQAQAKGPLPPIFLVHILSISLIKTIDLFIRSGWGGGEKPNMPFVWYKYLWKKLKNIVSYIFS